MSTTEAEYEQALTRASEYARTWLESVGTRRVSPAASADELPPLFGGPRPDQGAKAGHVVDLLATGAEPGLMAIEAPGCFYGWVMGGTLPAALGADWLVSAWDQNAGLRYATPAVAALEEAAAAWLLDLLGLPSGADLGFVTGGTMANFTCLAAGRFRVLDRAGWDVNSQGLGGAPRVHVLVGASVTTRSHWRCGTSASDIPRRWSYEQGRINIDALAAALDEVPKRRASHRLSASRQRRLRRL